MRKSTLRFMVVPLIVAIGGGLLLWRFGPVAPIWAWLIAINVVAFCTFRYDKEAARARQPRVPEGVLLALAFVGGWPLAYLAMRLSGHKTSASKAGFRARFWLLVVLEIALVVGFIWLRSNGGA